MADLVLKYDALVETALRQVVRDALKIAENGLPSQHHFYISFRTRALGVQIADWLRSRYADEMTIVLQHQYWGLKVEESQFTVTLSFSNRPETLIVPFDAVTAFTDPFAKFGLQFEDRRTQGHNDAKPGSNLLLNTAGDASSPLAAESDSHNPATAKEVGKIVTLDRFRKK